ncbi:MULTISPECIES: high frequency lysogenization protein HflD [Larsenimonas]|uniref:High frequency lysogenization protein HflD homolog n=1 Tax=Larsenimonas suaedae TaxID=1851019 RepID=A0ABU1GZJ1_9GAMM|nr:MULTISPECIES: high frequency lysogenization protein HflD [Larsenimonas]MCM2972828.1 high frequency lysogenization protein HflD [Larsenimonas suaedae]MCM5704775.1 high frequency lysogenization protein HflD [Larsenimonas salina]MDR5896927.1 high frequency lysogenization protein HflD [Larsenimonas suaedae]
MTTTEEQALALAGVFQAAAVADELARTGHCDERAWHTLLTATLNTDPNTFEDVYGGNHNNLRLGIKTLSEAFTRAPQSPNVMRYAFSMVLLMQKFQKHPEMMNQVGQRLERIRGQADHFGLTHENVVASLGELYKETLSTLSYRIVVQGDPSLLQSRMMPERVRAVLLSGIRFALLWHQRGGRRWSLLFQRGKLKRALDALDSH